ncbi:hypothetical protein C0036_05775 [Streptomyces sp. DJ]|nr:hypothetical protein C0036_05775 [Streptomyces sp. DJ]
MLDRPARPSAAVADVWENPDPGRVHLVHGLTAHPRQVLLMTDTETAVRRLLHGYTQYADLTRMRAPDASGPAMLLKADCVNEPARGAGGQAAPARRVVRAPGAEDGCGQGEDDPGSGGARLPPAAADLPGDRSGGLRTPRVRVHREDGGAAGEPDATPGGGHPPVLRRHPVPGPGRGHHGRRLPPGGARGRHRAGRIIADPGGAAGAVWRRLGRDEWQTLTEALDSPDGDRLHAV